MFRKLPLRWAFRLALWVVVGGWIFGVWGSKPVLAVGYAQADDNSGRIAGIVTNEQGLPLPGIEVQTHYLSESIWLSGLGTHTTQTDSAGAYQISNLEPGVYTVVFFDPKGNYAFELYGNAVNLTDTLPIEVQSGQITKGVDAVLMAAGTITGRVKMYDGTPVSQSDITYCGVDDPRLNYPYAHGSAILYYRTGAEWDRIKEIFFSPYDPRFDMASDTFLFNGLATGIYRLEYMTCHKGGFSMRNFSEFQGNTFRDFYDNAIHVSRATDITVTASSNTNLGELVSGINPFYGYINGRVTSRSGKPLAGIKVASYPLGDEDLSGWWKQRSDITDLNGMYTLPAVEPDQYKLSFFDPDGTYALGWYDSIDVLTGTGTINLNPLLDLGNRITGTIRMFDGTPVGQVPPQLIGGEPYYGSLRLYHQTSDLFIGDISFGNTSSQFNITTSTYSFAGLATGDYHLYYQINYQGQEYDGRTTINIPLVRTPPAVSSMQFDIIIGDSLSRGKINGKITNVKGEPLSGIQVKSIGNSRNLATTDSEGNYLLRNLIPGDYSLYFFDPNQTYAPTYYGDTIDQYKAVNIQVITNTTSNNINAILMPAGSITGTIHKFDGTPFSQLISSSDYLGIMAAQFYNGQTWMDVNNIKIETPKTFDVSSNVYTFGGLPTGTYRLHYCFWDSNYSNEYCGYLATEVAVESGKTTGDINIVFGTDNQRILALYALALDHDPDRIDNLAPQLAPAMQSIIAATRDQPNKTAVVLADAAGVGDTRVYVVQNGRATPVQGLPNAAFQLDPTLTEANMADGTTLGNFIRWARNTYPAEVTLFGFVGHGAPLVPATGFADIVAAAGGIRPFGPTALDDNLFPLPSRVDAYPSLTDNHPEALITPYDLATALRIGSNNGADPLQIADVAHCFAASIEELYELSPEGDQPYAEIILASPTYTYLDPPALGKALGAINTLMTPATMADQILQTYDTLIEKADLSDGDPDVEHPRLLVAVNSRQVARVKADWDKVAYALLQNFDGEKLQQAYLQSPKYDTTLCRPQDWALAPPDALSDLYGLAAALRQVYGTDSAVGRAAATVLADLEDTAILSRYQRNGTPWYAPQNAQFWSFDQHQGIALYTDLQGTPTAKAHTLELSWQSRWYTADPLGGENPRPFAFLQGGFNGVTWADVFAEYWRRRPDVTLQTALCFPTLADDPQPAALRAQAIGAPLPNTLHVGVPFTPAALIEVAQATLKPAVRFNLYDMAQTLLYSDTVHGGYWLTGTHQLAAQHAYVPATTGPLTLEIIIDPANHFIEIDEADNRLTQQYLVNAAGPLFPLTVAAQLATPTLVVQHEEVALSTQIHPRQAIAALDAQIYQFTAAAGTEHWQPVLRRVQTLDPAQPVLALAELSPGIVVVHLWARTAAGEYSAAPAVVEFNYAPADQLLAAGERHLYRFPTSLTAFDLTLAAQGNRDLFAWSPANSWAPEWHLDQGVGNGLTLPGSTEAGAYLIVVAGDSAGAYTLTAHPSTNPPTAVVGTDAAMTAPLTRPTLVEPVVTALGNGAWVPGLSIFLPVVQRP